MALDIKLVRIAVVCVVLLRNIGAVPPCDSQIYCDGPLLKTIQLAELFKDSKTFVDMHLKNEPDVVLEAFKSLSKDPSKEDLLSFVNKHFDGPNTEFETWTPNDTVRNPQFLHRVKDTRLKKFGKELCTIWSHLGRKIKKDVEANPQRYSLIYLPNPFIVPGGRFREIYYWDSYWVVKGLLTCEMYTTVKGMLENLLTFVDKYGKIPNGGRIYYTERSQPPLMIPMVHLYLEATNDTAFISQHIDTLVKEYNFWATHRNISITDSSGEKHTLNRYAAPITKPRPESFKEDFRIASNLSKDDAESLYSNLASGAETGWDFSSRWFAHEDTSPTLADLIVKNIIPVDLNSILCWNEKLLTSFFELKADSRQADKYRELSNKRREAIRKILWNDNSGIWFDYNFVTGQHRQHFYPSNLFPLYTGCYPSTTSKDYDEKAREYLQNLGFLNNKTGIPTSLVETGQQWDMPNGWPPLQEIVVTALDNSGSNAGHQMALDIVKKWVYSNWKGWARTQHMFEKYSVNVYGSRGGGGEYDVQEGFGWTNGVILDFLARYGAEFTLDEVGNVTDTVTDHPGTSKRDSGDTCDASTCGAQQLQTLTFTFLLTCYIVMKIIGFTNCLITHR